MAVNNATKFCAACRVEKSVQEFRADSRNQDGLHGNCRECTNRQQRERRAARAALRPSEAATVGVEFRDLAPLGFPGYRVGDDGSVWSCWEKYGVPGKGGGWPRIGTRWRRLKTVTNKNGGHLYLGLTQGGRGGKSPRKKRFVHRLVLEAFVGPCPEGMECCHNDGDPTNNQRSNLRWDTSEANKADAERHGTRAKGSRIGMSRLTDDAIRAIRNERAQGIQTRFIAAKYGIGAATVRKIVQRASWRHVV